jgi:hypothetical protein
MATNMYIQKNAWIIRIQLVKPGTTGEHSESMAALHFLALCIWGHGVTMLPKKFSLMPFSKWRANSSRQLRSLPSPSLGLVYSCQVLQCLCTNHKHGSSAAIAAYRWQTFVLSLLEIWLQSRVEQSVISLGFDNLELAECC